MENEQSKYEYKKELLDILYNMAEEEIRNQKLNIENKKEFYAALRCFNIIMYMIDTINEGE